VGQGVNVAVGCKDGMGVLLGMPVCVGLPLSGGESGSAVAIGEKKSGVSSSTVGNDAEGVGLDRRRCKS